jgi:hypothetical protein
MTEAESAGESHRKREKMSTAQQRRPCVLHPQLLPSSSFPLPVPVPASVLLLLPRNVRSAAVRSPSHAEARKTSTEGAGGEEREREEGEGVRGTALLRARSLHPRPCSSSRRLDFRLTATRIQRRGLTRRATSRHGACSLTTAHSGTLVPLDKLCQLVASSSACSRPCC